MRLVRAAQIAAPSPLSSAGQPSAASVDFASLINFTIRVGVRAPDAALGIVITIRMARRAGVSGHAPYKPKCLSPVVYWTSVQLASGSDELDTPFRNPRWRTTMVEFTRFQILTLAFALLVLISEASFAAQGSRHSRSAGVKNHSLSSSRTDVSRMPAFAPGGTSRYPYGPAVNFPYPDRPYGDPDRY
jgi:hypothetical protein